MAACLLLLANFWLAAALVLWLGRHVARTEPTMYSFLEAGQWFEPATYNLWVGLCLLAAAVFFIFSWLAWRHYA
jgi:hypothetical protein